MTEAAEAGTVRQRRRRAIVPIVVVLTSTMLASSGCAGDERDPPPADADEVWVVRPDGIGPVRIGMTLAEAGDALGTTLSPQVLEPGDCSYATAEALPHGVSLMVVGDVIARLDVERGDVETAAGARIGQPEEGVLELYAGRVRVEPHKYTGPDGHYLIVDTPDDPRHRIIFETDGARVTSYRAGQLPQVGWVEGCS